jgi:hypothetical protein
MFWTFILFIMNTHSKTDHPVLFQKFNFSLKRFPHSSCSFSYRMENVLFSWTTPPTQLGICPGYIFWFSRWWRLGLSEILPTRRKTDNQSASIVNLYVRSLYSIDRDYIYNWNLDCKVRFDTKCGINVSLFDCFEPQEQFFSYLAAVTITGDGAANLDLCLALTAFSSVVCFTCHTSCDTGTLLRSYTKDLWFSLLNAVLLAKEQ